MRLLFHLFNFLNPPETGSEIHKIPPNLPLLKGGIIPLFGKEGRGEISGYLHDPCDTRER